MHFACQPRCTGTRNVFLKVLCVVVITQSTTLKRARLPEGQLPGERQRATAEYFSQGASPDPQITSATKSAGMVASVTPEGVRPPLRPANNQETTNEAPLVEDVVSTLPQNVWLAYAESGASVSQDTCLGFGSSSLPSDDAAPCQLPHKTATDLISHDTVHRSLTVLPAATCLLVLNHWSR